MWRMYIRSHVRAHASTYACIIYICIHIRVVYIYILGDVLGALGTYVGTCVHIYRIRLIRISNQQIGAHSLRCSLRTIILDITARITSATQLPFCLFALIKLARNLSRLIRTWQALVSVRSRSLCTLTILVRANAYELICGKHAFYTPGHASTIMRLSAQLTKYSGMTQWVARLIFTPPAQVRILAVVACIFFFVDTEEYILRLS